jgi:hypothetical protein
MTVIFSFLRVKSFFQQGACVVSKFVYVQPHKSQTNGIEYFDPCFIVVHFVVGANLRVRPLYYWAVGANGIRPIDYCIRPIRCCIRLIHYSDV